MSTPALTTNLAAPLAPQITHSSRNPDKRGGAYLPPDEASAARVQHPRGGSDGGGGMYYPSDDRRGGHAAPPPRGGGAWSSSPYDEGDRLPLYPHEGSRPLTSRGHNQYHGQMRPSDHGMMPIQPRQPERGGIFLTSDDHALARTIESYHNPDARDVNVRPLLVLVRQIIDRCIPVMDGPKSVGHTMRETKEGKFNGLQEVPELPLIVDRISSEITSKLLGGVDAHSTTLSVLNMLQHFSWEAKVVLAMAAFALNYGDFWLLVQLYSTDSLANSMALIKRLPMVVEHEGALKHHFEATNNLISAMFEATQCIIEFGELPTGYFTAEDPEVKAAMSHFPIAVYWIIRSSVAVAAHIITISTTSPEYSTATSQSWELSNWTHKLKTISNHLRNTLSKLYQLIGEKRDIDEYNMIKRIVNKPMHVDNLEVLNVLISHDDAALYYGPDKRRVPLERLRGKNVLLLISDLNLSQDELYILEQSYTESRVHKFEIIWIPVVDHLAGWTDDMQERLETLHSSMPWYSVHHPSMIKMPALRFIREDWHFMGKPMLVVLDPQGKILSHNAIHMMWIWQTDAFPFTRAREATLWEQQTWELELLVNGIDPKVLDWIKEGKYIFVYGGDDIEWIRRFTREAHAVARALEVPVEMVYVGRSHNKEVVRKVTDAIYNEQLSHCWQEPTMIWWFWTRIESMIYSKFQVEKVHDPNDVILQEIQRLHSHDKTHDGWAILARGNRIVVHGHGKIALVALEQLEQWKPKALQEGFDVGYGDHYLQLHLDKFPCHRIEFPAKVKVPKTMLCPDCRRHMQNYNSFICCHDDDGMIAPTQLPSAVQFEG